MTTSKNETWSTHHNRLLSSCAIENYCVRWWWWRWPVNVLTRTINPALGIDQLSLATQLKVSFDDWFVKSDDDDQFFSFFLLVFRHFHEIHCYDGILHRLTVFVYTLKLFVCKCVCVHESCCRQSWIPQWINLFSIFLFDITESSWVEMLGKLFPNRIENIQLHHWNAVQFSAMHWMLWVDIEEMKRNDDDD